MDEQLTKVERKLACAEKRLSLAPHLPVPATREERLRWVVAELSRRHRHIQVTADKTRMEAAIADMCIPPADPPKSKI